jgi:sulfatase modifying factor 1
MISKRFVHISSAIALCLACWGSVDPVVADDVDGDGVDNAIDVCNNTPPNIPVDPEGRPLGDLDLDCDADLHDYALFHASLTGALPHEGMAHIPAGEFLMGDPWAEGDNDELPVHAAFLSAYYIDTNLVTNQQFADALNWAWAQGDLIQVIDGAVLQAGTSLRYCDTQAAHLGSRLLWDGISFSSVAGKENHPMVLVTWYGAAAYCNWRSGLEGRTPCYDPNGWVCDHTANGYRLPSEAEWEKAAAWDPELEGHFRFGEHTDGCGLNCLDGQRANYKSSGDPFEAGAEPYTTPVGFYNGALQDRASFDWPGEQETYQTQDARSYYGLYDMTGNLHEWCNDWYRATYYAESPYLDPRGPTAASFRVLRSSNWNSLLTLSGRSADRSFNSPVHRSTVQGLRCVTKAP